MLQIVLKHQRHCYVTLILLMAVTLSISGCDSEQNSTLDHAQLNSSTAPLPSLPAIDLVNLAPGVRNQFEQAQVELEASPTDGRLNSQYAKLLHAYSLYIPAAVMYERCRILRPSDLDCIYLHALVAKELGDFDTAIANLKQVLQRRPDYPRAATVLADSYRAINQTDQAIALFQSVLTKYPQNLEASYGLAQTYVANNDFEAAALLLHRMHQQGKHFGVVHSMLATLARRTKDTDLAAFHTNAASVYSQNKIPFSDEKLWEVQDMQGGDGRYVREANAFFKRGEYRQAAQRYQMALELNPKNDSVHADLVGIFGELGQISNAEHHFDQAIALNPKNILAYMNLGTVRMKRGEYQLASNLFASILERQSHHAQARTLRAYSLELLGHSADLDEYRQALKDDPNYQLANYLLARNIRKRQGCESALPLFEKSVQIESAGTPAYLAELASCYLELNKRTDAERVVTEGLNMAKKYGNVSAGKALQSVRQLLIENQQDIFDNERP